MQAYGTLLMLDEVQCGLGRTGKWFCFQHWPEVEPDIVCTAKALSGGYVPVGAVITRPKIMDCVFSSMERCVVHSNTYGQNDLAMAAALASLHVIEEEKLVENAAAMGEYVMRRLREMAKDCPFVSDVRGKGLMFAHRFRPAEESVQAEDGVGHAAQDELRRVRADDHDPAAAEAPDFDAGGGVSHGGDQVPAADDGDEGGHGLVSDGDGRGAGGHDQHGGDASRRWQSWRGARRGGSRWGGGRVQ